MRSILQVIKIDASDNRDGSDTERPAALHGSEENIGSTAHSPIMSYDRRATFVLNDNGNAGSDANFAQKEFRVQVHGRSREEKESKLQLLR